MKELFDGITNLFYFLIKSKKKPKKCRYCGHKRTEDKNIIMCNKICSDKFLLASMIEKEEYIKNFQIDPTKCPFCKVKQDLHDTKKLGSYCTKCGKLTPP